MKNIVIFGAPGAGKGTQSDKMIEKYGLKIQKLQKQHALKGQKLLAQGIALGNYVRNPVAL